MLYFNNKHIGNIIVLLCVWVVLECIINPTSNFPMNDDWAYAFTVKHWLDYSEFKFHPWGAMTLIGQIIYGLPFCFAGFSHTALRISTISLGIFCSILLYFIGISVANDRKLGLLLSLCLICNPLFFPLSNTFMTDIPFLFFFTLSTYFFILHERNEKNGTLVAAIFFTLYAISIRQIGLVLPIAYTTTQLISRSKDRNNAWIGLLVLVASATFYIALSHWIKANNISQSSIDSKEKELWSVFLEKPDELIRNFKFKPMYAAIYLGLFLLPYSLSIDISSCKKMTLGSKLVAGSILAILLLRVFGEKMSENCTFPYFYNMLDANGIGPVVFRDTPDHCYPTSWRIKNLFSYLFSVVGAISFTLATLPMIVYLNNQGYKDILRNKAFLFLTFLLIGYSLLVFTIGTFDRYLLPLMVIYISLILLLREPTVICHWGVPSTAVLFAMLLYTSLATQNLFDKNRIKWDMLEYLTHDLKVPPSEIDGGFEFNGTFCFNTDKSRFLKTPTQWYWVINDKYSISYCRKKENYKVLSYKSVLNVSTLRQDTLFLMKRW